MRKVTSTGMRK